MVENKTDRRVRRTKRLLLKSLTSLMKEKPIKDISVKELTDLADINRGTFYLHYRDISEWFNSWRTSGSLILTNCWTRHRLPPTAQAVWPDYRRICFSFFWIIKISLMRFLAPTGI